MKKWIAPFVISSLFFTSLSYGAMMKFDLESLKNKTLDIEQFERKKNNRNVMIYTLPDGSSVRIREKNNGEREFTEDGKSADGIYSYQLQYDANGKVVLAIKNFYSMVIGKVYYFNHKRMGTNIDDTDKGFGISLDELIIKLKKEHDIDLLNPENVFSIERDPNYSLESAPNEKRPVYILNYTQTGEHSEVYSYCIDGNTGDILHKDRLEFVE